MPPTQARSMPAQVILLIAAAAMLLATGCQSGGPIRAIWVTRFDYRTEDDITRIMKNCSDAGFNVVVFQVRGNGTVFYPSKIEPWAEQFDYKDPGYDPLQVALREAHARNMLLHAWMNIIPAWRGTEPPACAEHLYHTHPDWFWYDQHGNRQALSTFYVSVNPCLPEVREYLVSVIEEVVANYAVDGVHMDYIRFPSEPPAIPEGSDIDYPYDAKTLALFKEETGMTPENEEAWKQWRLAQVTKLVADIHAMMRRTRPKAVLAASLGTDPVQDMRFFRDSRRWADTGIVDEAYPMNYERNLEDFNQGLAMWLPHTGKYALVPGLWFQPGLSPEEGSAVVRQQIESAIEKTGNVCVFAYASLFDTSEVAGEENEEQRDRRIRREVLLPYLRSLAK
ncbi:MAG: family 10 glycosylhydrolase [Phycisphaerae bacterium]|nr:family 10 glycosylhydrolase [Phycisphaerae bacterium]